MGNIEFLKEGLKNLKTVGTISRSSKALCKGMIKHINFEEADFIVELGAGDGVITTHILKHMKKDARLLVFEVNKNFCEILHAIDDDRLIVIEDSAEHVGKYIQEQGVDHIDYVISALPFVVFPKEVALQIIGECSKYLKQSGLYIQVHYSLLVKKLYQSVFGNVDVNFIPFNVPPAFVFVSQKY
jgi:phospholipid N-methyltransferase